AASSRCSRRRSCRSRRSIEPQDWTCIMTVEAFEKAVAKLSLSNDMLAGIVHLKANGTTVSADKREKAISDRLVAVVIGTITLIVQDLNKISGNIFIKSHLDLIGRKLLPQAEQRDC